MCVCVCVSGVSGKGKGSGQIGGLGVGGMSGTEVNAAGTLRDSGVGGMSSTEVDGSGGLGVGDVEPEEKTWAHSEGSCMYQRSAKQHLF